MNSFQVETFLAIAETQSISRAAEVLYLSQPTVSYRLKSLEEEIGFVLIDRRKGFRNVELSEKGKLFQPIAQKWMQLWREILLLASVETRIPLSLACENTLNLYVFMPLYKKLLSENESSLFDLTVVAKDSAAIYKAVERREIDLGLVFYDQPSKNLNIQELFREPYCLIRLRDESDLRRTAYHPTELNPAYELFYRSSANYQFWHDTWWNRSIHPYVNIDSPSMIPELLDDQRLWAVVPSSVAKMFEKYEKIKIYDILYPPEPRACYYITNKAPPESRICGIQLFGEYLRTFISTLDYVDPVIPPSDLISVSPTLPK